MCGACVWCSLGRAFTNMFLSCARLCVCAFIRGRVRAQAFCYFLLVFIFCLECARVCVCVCVSLPLSCSQIHFPSFAQCIRKGKETSLLQDERVGEILIETVILQSTPPLLRIYGQNNYRGSNRRFCDGQTLFYRNDFSDSHHPNEVALHALIDVQMINDFELKLFLLFSTNF